MKRYYLTLALFFGLSAVALGQSNYYKVGIGGGLGGTYSFTDVYRGSFGYAGYGGVDYYFTPFITAGLEVQKGIVKSQDYTKDPHLRSFTNSYMAVGANFKFRAGEITDYYYNDFLNYTKGFYLGTGLGYIQNNMTSIIRVKPDGSNYIFPGEDKGSSIYLPINVGIDFYLPDGWGNARYILNLNFQSNFVFADNLDGYNDPKTRFKNQFPDMYNFFSVGFKFNLGPMGLSSKTFR